MRRLLLKAVLPLLALWSAPAAMAQLPSLSEGADIIADGGFSYDHARSLIMATGNVVMTQGTSWWVHADYVTWNTNSHDVFASGNVRMRHNGNDLKLKECTYNLITKKGRFGDFVAYYEPYHITARDSERLGTNSFRLQDVTLTTCPDECIEYVISAREARLDGDFLQAKGVAFRFKGIPLFYLPSFSRHLKLHDRYFEVVPGYSSRQGTYLLSAYNYPVTEEVRGRTHLDYRTERGVGVGQDFMWRDREGTRDWSGEFKAYYADDQRPFRTPEEEARQQGLVDNQRYRVRLSHSQYFSSQDYGIVDLNLLSDPDVLKDFFDAEYRHGVQPENRLALMHRGNKYSAGLLINKQINDFYENVDRAPELTLNLQRQKLGDSDLYYESDNAAAYLQRVYPTTSDRENYEAFRLDTRHMLYWPLRFWILGLNDGDPFLNFTPRLGYRGTLYSQTRTTGVATNMAIVTDTNGISSVSTSLVDIVTEGGADMRHVYEVGFETSFKAFRTWNDLIVLSDGEGLRHIVEPYANYTFNPEPNLRPFELPQFDRIDRIDQRQDVRLGVRNKFQTKRNSKVSDIVDANIYTYYRIDMPEGESNDFSDVYFDIELDLAERFPIEFDGAYDPYESQFKTVNTRVAYLFDDKTPAWGRASRVGLEYRHRQDDYDLISPEIRLFPNDEWGLEAALRYDAKTSRLEEQDYMVSWRNSRCCLGYGLGFRHEPGYDGEQDDYQVWLRFWVLAFPGSTIDIGR